MLALDGTFLVILASFFIFMLLMKGLFFGPIMAVKTERETLISGSRQAADTAKAQAQQLASEREAALSQARAKAQALLAEKRDAAKQSAATVIAEARSKAQAKLDQELKALEASEADVLASLDPLKPELSQLIIQQISGDSRLVGASR